MGRSDLAIALPFSLDVAARCASCYAINGAPCSRGPDCDCCYRRCLIPSRGKYLEKHLGRATFKSK